MEKRKSFIDIEVARIKDDKLKKNNVIIYT